MKMVDMKNMYAKELTPKQKMQVIEVITRDMRIDDEVRLYRIQSFLLNWLTVNDTLGGKLS